MKYLTVGIWIIFRLPPYFRTPSDFSSAALRVRRSISLSFGFTFRSHTNHSFVPPFFFLLNFCYVVTILFLPRFRLPAEISSNPFSHLAIANASPAFMACRAPSENSSTFSWPRSQFAVDRLLFWLPWGLFRSLTVGRNHRFLYPPFLFLLPRPCGLPAVPWRLTPICASVFILA